MQANHPRPRLHVNRRLLVVVKTRRPTFKPALTRVQHGVVVRPGEIDEHGELAFHALVGAKLCFVDVGSEPGVLIFSGSGMEKEEEHDEMMSES